MKLVCSEYDRVNITFASTAYPGDIIGSISDHCNKASHMYCLVSQGEISQCKNYVYIIVYSIKHKIASCLKKCTLIEKYLIAKINANHH